MLLCWNVTHTYIWKTDRVTWEKFYHLGAKKILWPPFLTLRGGMAPVSPIRPQLNVSINYGESRAAQLYLTLRTLQDTKLLLTLLSSRRNYLRKFSLVLRQSLNSSKTLSLVLANIKILYPEKVTQPAVFPGCCVIVPGKPICGAIIEIQSLDTISNMYIYLSFYVRHYKVIRHVSSDVCVISARHSLHNLEAMSLCLRVVFFATQRDCVLTLNLDMHETF